MSGDQLSSRAGAVTGWRRITAVLSAVILLLSFTSLTLAIDLPELPLTPSEEETPTPSPTIEPSDDSFNPILQPLNPIVPSITPLVSDEEEPDPSEEPASRQVQLQQAEELELTAGTGRVIDYGAHNSDSGLWIVQLASLPLASQGDAAWSNGRLNVHGDGSEASQEQLAEITAEQDKVLDLIAEALERPISLAESVMAAPGEEEPALTHPFRYRVAFNGFALALSSAEAKIVASLPGVVMVASDYNRYITTDSGPQWIGADKVWSSTDDADTDNDPCGDESEASTCGEGVVVGVIDTGINLDHSAFADPGPVDGYDHENPNPAPVPSLNGRYGVCGVEPFISLGVCNDKLIGAYDFTGVGGPAGFPEDENGHGTHTASTSAGNVVDATLATPTVTYNDVRASGVAPHANIIAYKSCIYPFVSATGTCTAVQLVAAIDQAVADEVDVINFSIGGGPSNPYIDADSLAFLSANEAGIFASISAGNEGSGPGTVGSPANSPWVMAVGASTHDRAFANALIGLSADEADSDAPSDSDMRGLSITGPSAADLPLVWAGDIGFPQCAVGGPDAATNPFLPGQFAGDIVVCERGGGGRVQVCSFVADAGAEGCVLINAAAQGNSIVADPHVLPAVHLTYDQGNELLAWLIGDRDGNRTGGDEGDAAPAVNPIGQIAGTELDQDPTYADIMAGFSSRGPNSPLPDVIKPDVTAPGVDILAAWRDADQPPTPTGGSDNYNVISGTSMSSPHDAGAAALLRGVHPDWTPDQVKSALMTTAFTSPPGAGAETHPVLDNDGVTEADPFDMGAGRIDVSQAARAGLLLDESAENYVASDPDETVGGDPTSLNIASFGNANCVEVCGWMRTLTSTQADEVTWTALTEGEDGLALTVSPAEFTITSTEPQQINVSADVTGLVSGGWKFGSILLIPDDASIPAARFPVAVQAQGGAVPTLPLHFHGNPHQPEETDEALCTGNGAADLATCGGPYLLESSELYEGEAAQWGPVPQALDGTAARNIYDPNWIWCLSDDAADAEEVNCPADGGTRRGETTLAGPMTVRWWASTMPAGEDLGQFFMPWVIRIWADGELAYESNPVVATPAQAGIPDLLEVTVPLPEITASQHLVLHVDVWSSTDNADQQGTFIYYDSTEPCNRLTASEEPCDSVVLMPVVGLDEEPPVDPTPPPPDNRPTPPGNRPTPPGNRPTPPPMLPDTSLGDIGSGLAAGILMATLLASLATWSVGRKIAGRRE